ncbi:MAG: TonB-dependent receptor [Desulfobacteraceae bacterium]|nr:MAG: TonB-dependent receptor [Desulfobacteraceae bacterium]
MMKRNILLRNVIVFFTMIPVFCSAGTALSKDRKQAVQLDTVVVTAEKIDEDYQTGDVDTSQSTAQHSIIKREYFDGKMQTLPDVIEKEAGVQIRQTGGLGSLSTVSLRGSGSDQVMIYLDGTLLNDASGGGVDLSNISLSDVESIEIYRGTTPIHFNNASIGGAINIKTLKSGDGLHGHLKAGYGSFQTRELSGLATYKPEEWDTLLLVNHLAGKNNYTIENKNGTPLNPNDDRKEKRNNAEFSQYNVLAKFGYDLTTDNRIDIVNQGFLKDQNLPAWNNSATADASLDTRRNITSAKLTLNDIGALHLNTATEFSYLYKDEDYQDRHGSIGLGNQHFEYITRRYGGQSYIEWPTDHHTAILTFDLYQEAYDPEDLLSETNLNSSTRNSFGIGFQDNLMLLTDRLIISPAIRYVYIDDELQSGTDLYGDPMEGISRQEGYWSPQIGFKFQPSDWIALKSNLNKYYRTPSFFELFGDRGFFMGNSELKPETGVNFDAGVEAGKTIQNRLLNGFSTEIVYFQSHVDDLITRVYDARGIGKSVNISGAAIQGMEVTGKIKLFEYFQLIGNATIQDAENQSRIKGFDGKKLPGIFSKQYLGRMETSYRNAKLFVEYVANKDMYYDAANLLKAKDQAYVNTGISWLIQDFLISVEAKNITDNQYEDYNGYPMPGVSYFGSVKYTF